MKTKRICKSTVSLILAVMMIVSMFTVGIVNASAAETDVAELSENAPAGTKLYLKPGEWDKDGARFACYFYNNGEAWVSATKVSGTDYYEVTVPNNGFPNLIWVRMNGSTSTNNWDNKWNQTGDLSYEGKNLYTVSNYWAEKADGSWSNYTVPYQSGSELYLNATTTWDKDGAWFAARFFNSTTNQESWVKATSCGDANTFKVTVPSGDWDRLIWVRMDKNKTALSFDSKWNQTGDLWPVSGKNCFKISHIDGAGSWENHTCTGGSGGGGDDDGGDTDGTKRYYIGKRSFLDIDYIKVYDSNNVETTINSSNLEFIDADTTVKYNVTGQGESVYDVFSFNLDAKYKNIIIHCYHNEHSNDNWSTEKYTLKTGEIILLDEYSGLKTTQIPYTPTDTPTDKEFLAEETSVIKLVDKSGKLASKDSKMFAHDTKNDVVYEMTKTVDTDWGYDMWIANLEDIAGTDATFDFYCTSIFGTVDNVLDGSATGTWWGKWTAGKRDKNITFVVTGSENMWSKNDYPVPAGTMRDLTYGIWVDTKGNGDAADAVVARRVSDDVYHLYLPSHSKDMETLEVYTSFYGAKLSGGYYTDKKLVRGTANTISFRNGTTTYTVKDGGVTYTLKVYKSDNASTLFMNTNRELYTETIMSDLLNGNAWPSGTTVPGSDDKDAVASEYKDAIETKGTYLFYDENGTKLNSNNELKKIKGRGNSTFKASMEIYGKYAYNITLKEDEQLIPGATKSNKWCLLANNVDHTMMRNTFIFAVAEDIGLKYVPKTQLLDLYNKGQYLGAYVITEKVEYGSGTLMNDLANLDDANETASENAGDAKTPKKSNTVTNNNYTAKTGGTYSYQCKSFTGPTDYQKYNFLLEFELFSRYENEASWFVSNRTGQAVVVKYPEYANQEQMKWIIDQYDAVEKLIYENTTASVSELSRFIDVDSFAKMYLIQELSLNLDACATSFYIHNQFTNSDHTESVLYASPVWDYDWSMGAYSNTSDSGRKYYYNGSTTIKNSTTMDDPKQMFINKKALRTDSDQSNFIDNYNFQAMLTKNANYWKECQLIYTNLLVPTMDEYIYNLSVDGVNGYDENDKMLNEWLSEFKPSVTMNNARWGAFTHQDNWGTKLTSEYSGFSVDSMTDKYTQLGVSANGVGTATSSYNNTVYYLNDWLAIRWNYMSSSSNVDCLYLEDDRYRFDEDLTFTLTQNAQVVTIDPYAKVLKNDTPLDDRDVTVVVYVNGVAQNQTYTLADIITLTLDGGAYSIYLEAYPTAYQDVIQQSETKSVNVTKDGQAAKIEIKFKCSDSYRYTPTITCGDTSVVMTKIDEVIAKNPSTAQSYYWYTATVEAIWGQSMTVNFKNLLQMDATYTINEVRSELYYFAVDNMNTGSTVVDLTGEEEHIRNACKSAVNMVENDPHAEGLTTTSFNGGHYVVGDTDIDETLSIKDVTLIQLALAERKQLTDTATKLADFNLDGTTSIYDATGIQIYLVQ